MLTLVLLILGLPFWQVIPLALSVHGSALCAAWWRK